MVAIKNKLGGLLLPFENLSKQTRILQIFRLFSAFCALVFIIFTMVSPFISEKAYLARINCAHLDVSYGLYKSLRNSVSLTSTILDDSNTNAFPVDSSLTNSEISILTEYAESQVASAPQYIITTLWSWCYGNYNTTQITGKDGRTRYIHHDDTLSCSKGGPNGDGYVFDYRQQLESIGLNSILAYAFQTTKYDDESYSNLVQSRHQKYLLVVPALTFAGATQLILLVLTLIIYSNRKGEPDLSKVPSFLLHIMALISMASFLSLGVGSGIITRLLVSIRSEVKGSLGDFGVSLQLGNAWFLLLWFCFSFGLLSMLSWVFPLWCANPVDDLDDETYNFDYEDNFNHNHHYENQHRRKSSTHFFTNFADNSDFAAPNSKSRKRMSGIRTIDENEDDDLISRKNTTKTHRSSRSNRSQIIPSGIENDQGGFGPYQDRDVTSSNNDEDDDHEGRNSSTDLYYTNDEESLRKLGESLSRKSSVRHLYKKSKSSRLDLLPEEEETKLLLYNENTLSDPQYPRPPHHYREETYDGYVDAHKRSDENNSLANSRSNSWKNKNRNRSRSNSNRALAGSIPLNNTVSTNIVTNPSSNHSKSNSLANSNSNSIDNIRELANRSRNDSENIEIIPDSHADSRSPSRKPPGDDRYYHHNPKNNPFLQSSKILNKTVNTDAQNNKNNRFSLNDSLLNEAETNLLDNSDYLNHLYK